MVRQDSTSFAFFHCIGARLERVSNGAGPEGPTCRQTALLCSYERGRAEWG
ncbi:hypothetical protein KNP414_07407 [Paenibacillus mucilaginosus KNP414]|uniref:Uncharacterized protein n=1 Tax=Paenibacillus mucilaginosus (strain KNP414) TaxID=1036673 RepID=F8FPU4_PAEMK|nr:hypothetical protein KNP414_07407 [Paenibacillus mucilaginosus KNP414]